MEHLISSFIRVLRKLDNVDDLLATFQEFENNPSAVSADDRARLLDLPDLATQVKNIATASPATINKQDLLEKAAESPRDLTWPEIDVLKSRYWGKIAFGESMVFCNSLDLLAKVSQEHSTATFNRLKDFQGRLYEQHEAKAFENASDEEGRRLDDMQEDENQAELNQMVQKGQPWLQQLWQEDQGKKPWGYAIFENPRWKAENPDLWEAYERKSEHSRRMAFFAILASMTIESRYVVEPLKWPPEAPTEDESFLVILCELRKQFNHLRSCPPRKDIPELDVEWASGSVGSVQEGLTEGLTEGILQNVFLYLDGNAAASVVENHFADDFWIWAIDPDYVEDTKDQSPCGYKGYLRVRLQQLIHNFHVARRWHANEVSLKDLWEAAQKDPYNGSFVSLEDEEIFALDSSWEVASAVRTKKERQ